MSRNRENHVSPASAAPSMSKQPQAMPNPLDKAWDKATTNMASSSHRAAEASFSKGVKIKARPVVISKAGSRTENRFTAKAGSNWYWVTSNANALGSVNFGYAA